MNQFLILFREPDGRAQPHGETDTKQHRQRWAAWMDNYGRSGHLAGGSSLSLNGVMIKGREATVVQSIYYNGTEIVGGFLLLKAANLGEATEIMRSCPIYEADGYAEIREMQSH